MTLEHSDAIQKNINTKLIDIQILRVITPDQQTNATVYNRQRNENNQSLERFSWLLVARVHPYFHPEKNVEIVYFMEARNTNNNFYNVNVQYRDNGSISIGSFPWVPCPIPIYQYMRGGIPFFVSGFSVNPLEISWISTSHWNHQCNQS